MKNSFSVCPVYYLGTLIGCLIGGVIGDKIGRVRTMMIVRNCHMRQNLSSLILFAREVYGFCLVLLSSRSVRIAAEV